MIHSTYTAAFQVSLRGALTAALAVTLAQLLRHQYQLCAMISAIIVTDLEPSQTRKLGRPRLAGTALGGTLGAAISALLSAWDLSPICKTHMSRH